MHFLCCHCHQDIKPHDILVEMLANGSLWKILVIDLGTARQFALAKDRSHAITGTNWFVAPEVIGGNCFVGKADSHSIGRTMLVSALDRRTCEVGILQVCSAKYYETDGVQTTTYCTNWDYFI